MLVKFFSIVFILLGISGCAAIDSKRPELTDESNPPVRILVTRWGENPVWPVISSCGKDEIPIVVNTSDKKNGSKVRTYLCEKNKKSD